MPAAPKMATEQLTKQHNKQNNSKDGILQKLLIILLIIGLVVSIVFPFIELISRAVFSNGQFVGLKNFIEYFSKPYLFQSMTNTITISVSTTAISLTLAFLYAYALSRTGVRMKKMFTYIGLIPLFAPTMMHGIALAYLFGNNGLFTTGFFGFFEETFGWDLATSFDIYGPIGIIISEVVYTFPQAFLILTVALALTDNKMYEAADTLGAGTFRKFMTITIPEVKYALISAGFVCFTLSFTDFGAPKVVGGQYNVLATDIYKQVIGQQNFSMGATIGIILTVPAVIAFIVDRIVQRKQGGGASAKAVAYRIKPNKFRDRLFTVYCAMIALAVFLLMGAIILAVFTTFWPYDLSFTLDHLLFKNTAGDGLQPYWNSLMVSAITAVVGTIVTFGGAYLIEKSRMMKVSRGIAYFLSILPLAIPGLVIGIAYVFFFNKRAFGLPFTDLGVLNPLHFLYGTIFILVLANIVHFYSVTFMTANTALKKLDPDFEPVSESMAVPFYKTFTRVTLPLSMPAILEMAMYYFVNSMTTISAVIFLYSADLKLASIAIVNMNDAGNLASAAAMALLIVVTNIVVRVLYEVAVKLIRKRTNAYS